MESPPLLEQILLRPDEYIGSVEKQTQMLWEYESFPMMRRAVTYVPGLQKVFDEVLVYAAERKRRDPSMDALHVEIDVPERRISVYNNAQGIPVVLHKEEGVYMPEMIFAHLTSSTDTSTGVRLANVFSTEFIIETADACRLKKYKQVFSENMGRRSEPEISDCKKGENWTRITFKPDLAKFNLTHFERDVIALMRKRVFDVAAMLGETVHVVLDGQRLPLKDFSTYVDWHIISAKKNRPVEELPRICEKVNDQWEVCLSLSEGQFEQVSFVNGIATIRGGTHVDYIANKIATHVMNFVNDKCNNFTAQLHDVKRHMWIFVNARIENPAFDSPTKEFLTTHVESFGSNNCDFSDIFLNKVINCGLLYDMFAPVKSKAGRR
ncbi:DNA topoisomerase 2-like [Oryza brachyantha]|uniref:DNA topoisomerase 2-like n=1 Tax=Oryza brachyantha TaxID=4533 RepID=UPI001ADB38D4|nr:DNA topoisomerase 2-like [Oryza brachyantha]